MAVLLVFQGNAPADVSALEAAVRRNPNHAPSWKAWGTALTLRGKLEESAAAFRKACALDAREPDACYFLGRTLSLLARYEEAREPFRQALETARPEAAARVYRAVALNLSALGETREAERHFQTAIRRHRPPAEPDPRVDYGAFLVREGRPEEALRVLQQAAEASPESARAHLELGRALLNLERPAHAAGSLERAVALNARLWTARLLLGRAYLRLGRKQEGEGQMRLGQEGWAKQNQSSATVK